MNVRNKLGLLVLMTITVNMQHCNETVSGNEDTGSLSITANGEDFVRNGFTTEDGWDVNFSSVAVHVSDPATWQVSELKTGANTERHPGHSHGDIPGGASHEVLKGDYLVELKVENTATLAIIPDAEIGNYNRLGFSITRAGSTSQVISPPDGPALDGYTGYTIVMAGVAQKNNETIEFILKFEEETDYSNCGPNEQAGVLARDGEATAEMTFHFDHVFGDVDAGPADPNDSESINFFAVGFGPFAETASEGTVDLTQTEMQTAFDGAVYVQLVSALKSIGHTGEAHCDY